MDFEVVYEDDDLLVVDKPAGLVTHPAPGHSRHHARRGAARPRGRRRRSRRARASCTGSTATPRACSWWRSRRRPTPSCVRMLAGARSSAATSRSWRGIPTPRRARSTPRWGATAPGATWCPRGPRGGARRSPTSACASGFRAPTLLDVRLETGRTHQIRAHLAAIGHPVCGDPRYGGAACGRAARARRASSSTPHDLMFRHPITRGNCALRVQTTCRAAASTRRSPAGASSRRARRELKDGNAGRLLSRPAPFWASKQPARPAAHRRHPGPAILTVRTQNHYPAG